MQDLKQNKAQEIQKLNQENFKRYASLSDTELFKEYKTSYAGLSIVEIDDRIEEYGKNAIEIISLVQQTKSDKAAKKLQKMISNKIDVIRDELPSIVDVENIVPGDIVKLSSGDMIPGDVRFLEVKDLFINQAALTGESNPVEKFATSKQEENITDIANIGYMGTNVVSGTGTAIVLTTGNNTYFGSMAKSIYSVSEKNSFEKGVDSISKLLIKFMVIMIPVILIINLYTKKDWWSSLIFAITIAVGLTPEMLPVIMTSTLAKGAVDEVISICSFIDIDGKAKRMTDELKIAYYDREIITEIAKQTGFSEEYINNISEKGSYSYPFQFAKSFATYSNLQSNQTEILVTQAKILKEIAQKGSCIIVGRGANVILKDYNPMNIFVYADMESKINRCRKKANEYFSMLIYLLIIVALIFTVVGIILVRPVSILLGANETMLESCVTYGKTLLIFLIPFVLQNCFQSFLIVAEKPTFGLIISIIAGITNMVLDFLFMYVLKMGVFGAALATGISQLIGGVITLVYFIRKNNSLLKLTRAKFERKAILQTCVNGSSEMLTHLSMSLVNMLFNMQLMKYAGADGVVAYGIIMYVGFIFSGTYLGYSIGTAPIIGYHYGAGNTDELKSLLKKSLKLIAITSIVMTGLAELSSRLLASIFVSYDIELLEMTTRAIRLFALSYIISGFNIFSSSFFTALNNGGVSAAISFLRTLVFQIAMIFLLPLMWGIDGIWVSVVFAEILALIVSSIFLIKNKKKYQYA